jgi:hypothetical protein
MIMRVEFYKDEESRLCSWIATPPKRRPFHGTTMAAGRDLPHDLVQFTIERALEVRDGFWGLLAHGGWFASLPGRKPTQQGRAIVRAHHPALLAIEDIVGKHYRAWQRGEPDPLTPTLDAMYARWRALRPGERLTLDWSVDPLPGPAPRSASHRAGRRGRGARPTR